MFLAHRYFTTSNLSLNPCPLLTQARQDARESDDSLDSYEAVKMEEKKRQERRQRAKIRREHEAHGNPERHKQGMHNISFVGGNGADDNDDADKDEKRRDGQARGRRQM